MAILPIVKTPNPVLRQAVKPIGEIDKKIIKLIFDMADTLNAQVDPQGVGLAAPQVGFLLSLFLTKPTPRSNIGAFINPLEIPNDKHTNPDNTSGDKEKLTKKRGLLEGCLSLPNYYSDVSRRPTITIRYTTFDLNKARGGNGYDHLQTKELTQTFNGFPAQIIQHEMDHLKGRLFIDLVLEQKSNLLKLTGDKWEQIELGKTS